MRLLLLAVLLVLPAFFAAAEVALLRLRPSRVEVLVEEEQAGARSILRLQRRLRRALLVSQLGATLALVALGWAGRGLGGRLWSDGSALQNTTGALLEEQSPPLPFRTLDIPSGFDGSLAATQFDEAIPESPPADGFSDVILLL